MDVLSLIFEFHGYGQYPRSNIFVFREVCQEWKEVIEKRFKISAYNNCSVPHFLKHHATIRHDLEQKIRDSLCHDETFYYYIASFKDGEEYRKMLRLKSRLFFEEFSPLAQIDLRIKMISPYYTYL